MMIFICQQIWQGKLNVSTLLCFRMETYNELLKEFHEETSPKDYLANYKTLLDELQLGRKRRKQNKEHKAAQLEHLQLLQQKTNSLSVTNFSFSIIEDSRLACSRLDGESAEHHQLKREQSQLEKEVQALKAKTIEITDELKIYHSKETVINDVSLGGGFAVLRQWGQVDNQASIINKQELRQQHILHDLKTRKQQLSSEIQQLIKNKQTTDKLLKRWRKSKMARINTVKQPEVQSDLQDVLQAFHFLGKLAIQYKMNIGTTAEHIKQTYNWHEDYKGNKGKLIRMYQQKGKFYDQVAATNIIKLYNELEIQLDRNQRAHRQGTQLLRTLEVSYQKLNDNLKRIHEKKQKYTIHALRKYFLDIQILQQKLAANCEIITKLTVALYELLRKVCRFFKTAERIMDKSQKGRKMVRDLPQCEFLGRFEQMLFRNPEEQLLEWSDYHLYSLISTNSLLRLYASAQNLSKFLEPLDNYEKVAVVAFKNAQEFPANMFKLLSEYFKIAKITQKRRQNNVPQQGFCVQSKDYYRRDNFKLLERLQNEQLKRKGLLIRIPINLLGDTEINQTQQTKPFISTRSLTPRPSILSREAMKYTNLASKHQQHSLRKQKIRKMLGRLDSISRSANRLPLDQNKSLNSSRMSFKQSNAYIPYLQSPKALRPQRKTVGVLSKLNCTTEGFS